MGDEIRAIGDLLVNSGFHAGLTAGFVGAVLVVSLWLVRRRSVYGWALALAAASAAGVAWRFEVDSTWISALFILAIGGVLVDVTNHYVGRTTVGTVVAWLPGVVGAVWAARLVGLNTPGWVMTGLAGFILVLAAGLWIASRSSLAALVGPMIAVSVAGSWVTVPETDVAVVLVGAVIPLGLLTFSPVSGRLLASGALTYAGLLGWVVMGGGLARPWTILGAWSAAVGITVVAAVASIRPSRPLWLFGLFVLYAIVVTRVADFVETDTAMALGALGLLMTTGVVAWYLPRMGDMAGAESSPVVAET